MRGRIFILIIAVLLNQEKCVLFHFLRSSVIILRSGRYFFRKRSDSFAGSWIPRYVIASFFHMNGKFCLHCMTCGSVRVMLRVCDFVKFILKCAMNWNRRMSLRRFGRVTRGLDRNRRMLSANAAVLYFFSAMVTLWIFMFSRILHTKGSRVRANKMGMRGNLDVCHF